MVVQLDADSWDKEVVKSVTPVIVDFWASWCGPCQMMGPIFEEVSKDYAGKLKFAKLSTEDFPDIAGEQNITGIPCLIVFNKGKEVSRIIGFSPKPVLKQKIDAALKAAK